MMGQNLFARAAARMHLLRASLLLLSILGLFIAAPQQIEAAQILIDFGAGTGTTTDSLSRQWNTIGSGNDLTGSPFTLLDTTNTDSGYRLSVSNPISVTNPIGFNGENTNGTTAPTGAALARNYPISATRDTVYGNTVAFSGSTVQAVRLTLSDLNPNELYSLAFFASRTGAGGDNREAEYFITGGNVATSLFLNASENTGNIVELTGIAPNGSNQITIDLDPGPNNTNSNRFFYLGVMEINTAAIPEPSTLTFAVAGLLGVVGFAYRRRRRTS